MRQASNDEVSKSFFKLMNNRYFSLPASISMPASAFARAYTCLTPVLHLFYSCFGKFGEDVRGRQTIHLVKDDNLFRRWVARSNFYSCIILSENTTLVRMERTRVLLDKPIYLTGVVLDKAKEVMTDFWYRGIMQKVHDPPKSTVDLMLTDTGEYMKTSERVSNLAKKHELSIYRTLLYLRRFLHLYDYLSSWTGSECGTV